MYLSFHKHFRFTVKWSEEEGVNSTDHQDYLKEFGGAFEEALKQLLDRAVSSYKLPAVKGIPAAVVNQVYAEVLEHCHSCKQKIVHFEGRKGPLKKIAQYVSSDESDAKPFVVCGASGSGRTSLMAKAAQQV